MEKPVIYSNLPGIKEVLKDSVIYIDPMRPEEIARAIEKILEDENFKISLVNNGKKLLKENLSENSFLNFFTIINNFRTSQKTWIF